MNRIYTNAWAKLELGPLPLRPDAAARTASSSTTASSAGSAPTASTSPPPPAARRASSTMMEDYLQTEWPDLKVWLTSTTEQWAVDRRAGPERARGASRRWSRASTSSHEALPHMAVARGHASAACRRGSSASASPASSASRSTCRPTTAARSGRRCGRRASSTASRAYGTEAMHVLRAEKGYIIVGQDTDGTVTPDDAGLGWAIGKAKPDFVGKRSLARPDMLRSRPQAAGRPADRRSRRSCWRRARRSSPTRRSRSPMTMIGHVTSSYWSADARPLDRAGAGRGRPRAHRADALRADARAQHRGRRGRAGVLRRGRSAPQWLSVAP